MNIEKNIPMPVTIADRAVGIRKTLDEMVPGDSIRIPMSKYGSWRTIASLRKHKVTCRKISDTEMRLWKVS